MLGTAYDMIPKSALHAGSVSIDQIVVQPQWTDTAAVIVM